MKKLWNNRKFRTFLQTALGVIFGYFAEQNFEINNKAIVHLIIIAIATGLSAVMPLLDEEE